MPTYDVECSCGNLEEVRCAISERNEQRCPKCGAKMRTVIRAPSGVQAWKPDWWWLSSKEKVHISSKRQLFEECRKRDKVAVCHDQEWKAPQLPPNGGGLTAAESYRGGVDDTPD